MQWYANGSAGVRYEGSLARGARSGRGKLTMPDGATYEGDWLNGKQNGKGKYSSPGGPSYEGEWKDGAPDGHGVVHGEIIDGIWKGGHVRWARCSAVKGSEKTCRGVRARGRLD